LKGAHGHANSISNLVAADPFCHKLLNGLDSLRGADGLAFVIVIVMAAPLKVAEAIRPSSNQAPINEKRDTFWTISRARNYLT
jgi:hypothetical protein